MNATFLVINRESGRAHVILMGFKIEKENGKEKPVMNRRVGPGSSASGSQIASNGSRKQETRSEKKGSSKQEVVNRKQKAVSRY